MYSSSLKGIMRAKDTEGGWRGRIGATEFSKDGTRKLKTVSLSLRAGGNIEIERGSWIDKISETFKTANPSYVK